MLVFGSARRQARRPDASRRVRGTVIVFDEHLINENWREDEYKAFQGAVEKHNWGYENIAFNLFTKQAAVRIL